ncbi:MAG TPA: hypothetical protein VJG66_02090 [Patescibacteria group bacterium]|nr:hypothetical protein [Patescibacteria group bacterium]
MAVEKVSASFVPAEVDQEVGRMDSEGSSVEGWAVARAIRRSRLNGGYLEDISPEAITMEGEGPGSIVERDLASRASEGARGLVGMRWVIDRTDGSAIGAGVRKGAIARADIAANGVAKLHAPRTTGGRGNGTA